MNIRTTFWILLLGIFMTRVGISEAQELTLERPDKSKINYYLIEQPAPVTEKVLLLILQGSDCNSIFYIDSIKSDYKNIWPQADLLLIEKYGISKKLSYHTGAERKDCPEEYIHNDSPEQRISDIKAVLKEVRKQQKYRTLVVLGGSEGAVIANLLAANIDYVDATISFNGGGRWFFDDILHSMVSTQQNPEEAKASREGLKQFAEHILTSEPFELKISDHGYNWWHQMLSMDQLAILQKVNSPLLILQGSRDLSVSPDKVDEMLLALSKSGKDNIKYRLYDGLDHAWKNSSGQSKKKKIVADIHIWLKSVLSHSNNHIKPSLKSTAETPESHNNEVIVEGDHH